MGENAQGDGGGSEIEMEMSFVDPKTLPAGGGGVEAPEGQERREVDERVNSALVKAACAGLNSVIVGMTGYQELEFSEEEVNQLDQLWSPILPTVSPVVAAIIGTVIIVGGKLALYRKLEKGGSHGATDTGGGVRRTLAETGGDATERAAAAHG